MVGRQVHRGWWEVADICRNARASCPRLILVPRYVNSLVPSSEPEELFTHWIWLPSHPPEGREERGVLYDSRGCYGAAGSCTQGVKRRTQMVYVLVKGHNIGEYGFVVVYCQTAYRKLQLYHGRISYLSMVRREIPDEAEMGNAHAVVLRQGL